MSSCEALRVSFTGELGWELHVPMADMPMVFAAIVRAGEPHGLGFFGSHALGSMRMEKGYKVSADMTNEVSPYEAGLMTFINAPKEGYIGREPLLANMEAPRWKLVLLSLDAAATDNLSADLIGGEGVFSGDKRVGVVTTTGYGHTTGTSLAWAYVDPDQDHDGNELTVLVLGQAVMAGVITEPPWDPSSERARA